MLDLDEFPSQPQDVNPGSGESHPPVLPDPEEDKAAMGRVSFLPPPRNVGGPSTMMLPLQLDRLSSFQLDRMNINGQLRHRSNPITFAIMSSLTTGYAPNCGSDIQRRPPKPSL